MLNLIFVYSDYSTENNVPQESELPNDMQEPDLLVSIMDGAPVLAEDWKIKESREHCMIKAYEYRSGFGSETEQLKPLNRFLSYWDSFCNLIGL